MSKVVVKRDNTRQELNREKIKHRLVRLCSGLDDKFINVGELVDRIFSGVNDGISTEQLDNLMAETCAYMSIFHPDYSKLAGRLKINSLHKFTQQKFSEVAKIMHAYKHPKTGLPAPLLADDVFQISQEVQYSSFLFNLIQFFFIAR